MKYPHIRDELVSMLEQDQQEVRAYARVHKDSPSKINHAKAKRLHMRCLKRAERMLEIMHEIGSPIVTNIGKDGSQALSVIAIHSRLSVMREVLQIFESCYKIDQTSIYYEAIPSLTDRVLILEQKKQSFGTQWMVGSDGAAFLYPVENFEHMNQRRAMYGLGPGKLPIDLSNGIPQPRTIPRNACKEDQRSPTPEEYSDYADEYLS